ncbi:fungal chitosanase of glycosyl hydrolase group 75-domain-containing protein [Mycena sp. CBHHK59/15]|nr:fungal chitosanase of glycosyl hydrolase group 75-domain-containing protein [Mycena sp. CBHHK59/15]
MISAYFCALAVLSVAYSIPLLGHHSSPHAPAPSGSATNQTIPTGVAFAADPSINVAAIYAATQAATSQDLASFPINQEQTHVSHIYGDWLNLPGVSALQFIADMDIDCDGVAYQCPGNTSGQPTTANGALDATKVPYFVIPDQFRSSQLKSNCLGAIICDGNMFYAIFGDTNGDGVTTEVIGEASILLAQTCFPNAGIDGNVGHDQPDVAYIVFGEQVPSGVGVTTIDIAALKTLGDQQVKLLQTALNIDGGASANSSEASSAVYPSSTSYPLSVPSASPAVENIWA